MPEHEEHDPATGESTSETASPRIRVFLVEDEALIRESLRARLEIEPGVQVVGEAGRAEQALQELETMDVDVVLMDIGLPDMDGIEATRQLRVKRPHMPVVILTSYQDEYLGAAIEAGASGYLLKTGTSKQLVEAIQAAARGEVPLDPSLTGRLFTEVAVLRQNNRESLLSERQMDMLKLVADGIQRSEIATQLFVSESTVTREMRAIFDRLGVNDAAHAVSEAHKRGLI